MRRSLKSYNIGFLKMDRDSEKEPLLEATVRTEANGGSLCLKQSWYDLGNEVKKQLAMAVPMIGMNMLQSSLQLVSLIIVGHLSELSLSSASLATSFANVTGFSLLCGMACALETLCGQAFGAKQYRFVGILMQRAVIILFFTCIPLSIMWVFMRHILLAFGQDPSIAFEAGEYAKWLIPSLIAYAFLQPLVKFLQTQSIVMPMMLSSALALVVHAPLCWYLVFKIGLGTKGAALSMAFSSWLNVAVLSCYIKFSTTCSKTRASISKEALYDINNFLMLAVPSTLMLCLEWWSYETLLLFSGLLPNPELQTSVLSICLNAFSFAYTIPYGIASAVSTRVSNELGAGNSEGALKAVRAAVCISITESLVRGATLFSLRNVLGHVYSNEQEVIQYMAAMIPILAISAIMDGLQGVLSGIMRGSGQQKLGAIANLLAYYIVGIPSAAVLSFLLHYNAKGLWLGILGGLATQTILLSLATGCMDWKARAEEAKVRMHASTLPVFAIDISKDAYQT